MVPRKRAFTGMVGLPPEPVEPVQPAPVLNEPVVDEKTLAEEFGVEDRKAKPKLPDSCRTLLNLAPDDIMAFFDAVVGQKTEFVETDFLVPKEMLEGRVRRLQMVIARSKEIVEGLSVRVMKIRR